MSSPTQMMLVGVDLICTLILDICTLHDLNQSQNSALMQEITHPLCGEMKAIESLIYTYLADSEEELGALMFNRIPQVSTINSSQIQISNEQDFPIWDSASSVSSLNMKAPFVGQISLSHTWNGQFSLRRGSWASSMSDFITGNLKTCSNNPQLIFGILLNRTMLFSNVPAGIIDECYPSLCRIFHYRCSCIARLALQQANI